MEPGTAIGGAIAFKKLAALPFVVLMAGGAVKVNYAKIGETVIGAVIAGALATAGTTYVLTQRLEVKVETMQASISEMKDQIQDMRADLYSPYKPDGRRWTK